MGKAKLALAIYDKVANYDPFERFIDHAAKEAVLHQAGSPIHYILLHAGVELDRREAANTREDRQAHRHADPAERTIAGDQHTLNSRSPTRGPQHTHVAADLAAAA